MKTGRSNQSKISFLLAVNLQKLLLKSIHFQKKMKMNNTQNNQWICLDHYHQGHRSNSRTKPVINHSLENFIEKIQYDIFRPDNYQRIPHNLTTKERKPLQELHSLNNHTARIQDKGSIIFLQSNKQFCEKVQRSIIESPFTLINSHPTKTFEEKFKNG